MLLINGYRYSRAPVITCLLEKFVMHLICLLFLWILCQMLSMENNLDVTFPSRLCIRLYNIHIYLLIQVLSNLGNPYGYILPIVVY